MPSNLTISGSNTFSDFTVNNAAFSAVIFEGNSTQTIGNWDANGASQSNLLTITSNNTSQFNLVKSGGGTINANYLDVSYSNASPSNTWYNYLGLDSGNNQGWIFTAPPPPVIALRLTSTGNALIPNTSVFDEITLDSISIRPGNVYANFFDEVTLAGGPVPSRFTDTGNILISGIFDEVTGIS